MRPTLSNYYEEELTFLVLAGRAVYEFEPEIRVSFSAF